MTDDTKPVENTENITPESAKRGPGRPPAQPKPDVTLSRSNESEAEAEARGAKAKAHGGTNNEPGMDRPVPATTNQLNQLDEANRRAAQPAELEEDPNAPALNDDGTPKAMRAKSDDEVSVRITKKGHGQVFTGVGESTHAKGDVVNLDRTIAENLEDRGFVEIED